MYSIVDTAAPFSSSSFIFDRGKKAKREPAHSSIRSCVCLSVLCVCDGAHRSCRRFTRQSSQLRVYVDTRFVCLNAAVACDAAEAFTDARSAEFQ